MSQVSNEVQSTQQAIQGFVTCQSSSTL